MVFLAQIDTAGLGITLTAADTCVYYSVNFNYAAYSQSLARIHRIGQKNVVTVYKLAPRVRVEEKIIDIQEKKKKTAEQVLEGEGMDSVVFTKEEIMELLG